MAPLNDNWEVDPDPHPGLYLPPGMHRMCLGFGDDPEDYLYCTETSERCEECRGRGKNVFGYCVKCQGFGKKLIWYKVVQSIMGPELVRCDTGNPLEESAQAATKEQHLEIGELQRYGDPERMMNKVQWHHAGVLFTVVEHIGDLTHRMNDPNTWHSRGYEYVKEKVDRCLYMLTYPYGFDKEHQENIRSNSRYRADKQMEEEGILQTSNPQDVRWQYEEEYREKLDRLLEAYADAHRKLPVYNEAHRAARDAAVAVGEQNWDLAIENLRILEAHLGSRDEWVAFANEGLIEAPLEEGQAGRGLRGDPAFKGPCYACGKMTDMRCDDCKRYACTSCDPIMVREQCADCAGARTVGLGGIIQGIDTTAVRHCYVCGEVIPEVCDDATWCDRCERDWHYECADGAYRAEHEWLCPFCTEEYDAGQ